jgi:hypothetical protein
MVTSDLLNAYKEATFQVTDPPLTIRVGETTPRLDNWMEITGENEWAFITAYNPFSKQLPKEENDLRHERLENILKINYTCMDGYGFDKTGQWHPERSLLVMGIPLEKAMEIGRLFEQNAIVTGKVGEPAELTVLF